MSITPFTVKAVFEYSSAHEDDLNFPIGQIITVTEEEDQDWYFGEYTDDSGTKREGIFPRNFVEKYEPPAPPRPSRPSRVKKEADIISPPEPAVEAPAPPVPETKPEPEVETDSPVNKENASHRAPSPPVANVSAPEVPTSPPKQAPAPPPAPAEPAQKPASKPSPPAVADKPTGNSFKDRIAAFNKASAPPIAPLKPGGLSAQNSNVFIRKPFVAPPPSKDAYVPQPREPPPKIYRREEDPEVMDRISREPPVSEHRPAPTEAAEEPAEDQPKPTSLKERIALLQKQQLEQAARHAEAAQKKEKPKKPPKKRVESHEQADGAELERTDTTETAKGRTSEGAGGDEANRSRPTTAASHLASPPQPSRELVSDTNDADYSGAGDTEDAETSTGKEELDERPPRSSHSKSSVPAERKEEAQDEDEQDEETEEEEEEIDPEIKRRMELRERMAKMSGGMGMMGMFGPPGGLPGLAGAGPRKPKPSAEPDRRPSGESERAAPAMHAPPVPIMALPGMNARKPPEQLSSTKEVEKEDEEEAQPVPVTQQHPPEEVPDVEDVAHEEPSPRASIDRAPPPPPPQERPVPIPPPAETRPVPPPVPSEEPASAPPVPESRPVPPVKSPVSPSPGEESDDELSAHVRNMSNTLTGVQAPDAPAAPAPPVPEQPPRRPSTYDATSPKSPTLSSEKRLSRPPPPVPTSPPALPASQTRPPPPPPPASAGRRSTVDSRSSIVSPTYKAGEDSEGEVTEYDGDYDTDIAPGAKYKDALKAHGRDSSLDDGTITDDPSLHSPRSPPESRPPPPPPTAPRAVPPPPPAQPPKRMSIDASRGPPPPIPAPKEQSFEEDNEYDPYQYTAPQHGAPPPPPPSGPPEVPRPAENEDDELYDASPVQTYSAFPPPPSHAPSSPPPPPSRSQRGSVDFMRNQPGGRRSVDFARPSSSDQGYIAMDVDLGQGSMWWAQPNTPPPVFQNRKDLVYEIEESSTTKRGGKTTISKDVYVLFMDYSQTVVTVQFDAKNPADASLDQRHEPPPNRPRQDQLEDAHQQFGAQISEAVNAIQNTTVGDGTPHALIHHLLSPLTDALGPVGTRSYGALVYANLANASVQQNDEIRAGDIVSFRNARFQGHRGTMHQKYNVDVGKPDHVGVVVDWDGTKKKIRAWEQGRESKKIKMESFKLSDLKSGECKVWRVMPRSWIGWDSGKE
ncbi:hypothetical protein VTN00DRAFT_237 [Thermoascus crustaceus]|uniref:uncharacterized protein n=1 Tax=Thermoascus crustaceus TaxID=5088 RepID=UPI0037422E83